MKICICIPSRGRYNYVNRLLTSAFKTVKNSQNIIVKYYINEDDKQLDQYKIQLESFKNRYPDSVDYIIGPDQSPVYSWNLIAENTEADLYMLAGDESIFKTKHWDELLFKYAEKYKDGICVLAPYDERGPHSYNTCTTPIVTKQWAQALGYYWNPALWHWYIDGYTEKLVKAIDRFVYVKDVVVSTKKVIDKTGRRTRTSGLLNRDKWVYKKLMQNNFEDDIKKLKSKMV